MRIFDTHSHYNDIKFNDDLYDVLDKCRLNNIKKIVNISANLNDSIDLVDFTNILNNYYEDIDFYYTVGIHPDEILYTNYDFLNKQYINNTNYVESNKIYNSIEKLIIDNKYNNHLLAVGEIGLDYYGDNKKDENIRLSQKMWFINQLKLANKYNLPVVIHSRDAVDDTYDVLKNYLDGNIGIIHCYSYNKEYLYKFLDLGMYIGIGGVLTFKNGIKLKEVADICPLDRMVLETDCPYLAPAPHRGERNDSSYIKYILEELSRIKSISIDELSEICWHNSLKIYNLEE